MTDEQLKAFAYDCVKTAQHMQHNIQAIEQELALRASARETEKPNA